MGRGGGGEGGGACYERMRPSPPQDEDSRQHHGGGALSSATTAMTMSYICHERVAARRDTRRMRTHDSRRVLHTTRLVFVWSVRARVIRRRDEYERLKNPTGEDDSHFD